jgi:serine/threonine protein kinase
MSVEDAFGKVLGSTLDKGRIYEGIKHLSESYQIANSERNLHYFRDWVNILKPIDIKPTINEKELVVVSGRSVENSLKAGKIGAGTYGTCFISSDDKRVYKRIVISSENSKDKENIIEQKTRGVLVETFIQTILANDDEVGKYICKPNRLYRHSSVKRTNTRSATARGSLGEDIMLFIQMEPVKYKFDDYIKKLVNTHERPLNIKDLAPLFMSLGKTLNILKKRYNYVHVDLHTGNVMVSEDGTLKLIDFGMSCLEYEGKRYRDVKYDERKKEECFSYDLLIFLCSFLQFNAEDIDIATYYLFKTMLNYTIDGVQYNLYDVFFNKRNSRGEPAFWSAYSWEIQRDSKLKKILKQIPYLDPGFFESMMETLIPFDGTEAEKNSPTMEKIGAVVKVPRPRLSPLLEATRSPPATGELPFAAHFPNNNANLITQPPKKGLMNVVCNAFGRCFPRKGGRTLKRKSNKRKTRRHRK